MILYKIAVQNVTYAPFLVEDDFRGEFSLKQGHTTNLRFIYSEEESNPCPPDLKAKMDANLIVVLSVEKSTIPDKPKSPPPTYPTLAPEIAKLLTDKIL